jgi:hypothetical protein
MAFDEYIPRPDDIAWALQMLALLKDGGLLIFPTTRLTYEVSHTSKTLTLVNPVVLYDDADSNYNTTVHRRTIAVFRAVGYQVLVKEK